MVKLQLCSPTERYLNLVAPPCISDDPTTLASPESLFWHPHRCQLTHRCSTTAASIVGLDDDVLAFPAGWLAILLKFSGIFKGLSRDFLGHLWELQSWHVRVMFRDSLPSKRDTKNVTWCLTADRGQSGALEAQETIDPQGFMGYTPVGFVLWLYHELINIMNISFYCKYHHDSSCICD